MGIRHASMEDWPAVSEISTASGYDDYINTIGPSYMNDGSVVVYEEGRVLGFGKINYLEDGSAWLSGLRVHPDAWRKGVGISISRYLMQFAIEHRLYHARMLIEDRNTRSIKLSLKMGFAPVQSYSFFEGTPATSGFKPVNFKGQIMVNEGWNFVKISGTYRGKGEFMEDKIMKISRNVYGADDVVYSKEALRDLKRISKMGLDGLPVCMAKTQYSLSDDATLLNSPRGFKVHVEAINISAGAGFIVPILGEIMTMPGLPEHPAAENVDVDEAGNIIGLF